MPKAIERRIESLELAVKVSSFSPMNDAEIKLWIARRLAEIKQECREYEALPTDQKIAIKKQGLAESIVEWEKRDRTAFCINTESWHRLRCSYLKIEIMALEGAPDSEVQAARDDANNTFRYGGHKNLAGDE